MIRRAVPALALAAVFAATLTGCGSGFSPPGNRIRGTRLTIYASVPLHGASAVSGNAVVRGAVLALQRTGARIGRYRIVMRVLDDTTPVTAAATSGGAGTQTTTEPTDHWDPGQTTLDARIALADPTTIGYLGDLSAGASAVSIPLLNRLAIPQVGPGGSAVGLTVDAAGADPGEPAKYYPTGRRTFVRVVPNDLVQSSVQVALQRAAGCHATYVLNDGEVDGQDAASAFAAVAVTAHVTLAGQASYDPTATDYSGLGQSVAQSGADCVMFAGATDSNAVALVERVAAAVPHAHLFATAGLAESTFADPLEGGISAALDHRFLITAPGVDPAARAGADSAAAFDAGYARRYGTPEPAAVDGYEAMALMLDAIARATHGGRRPVARTQVVAALLRTRRRDSALGRYSIDGDGDTTLHRYGVYRIVHGQLTFWRSLPG